MAQRALVKNRYDFLVSCRSLAESRWMRAKVLQLKTQWPKRNVRRLAEGALARKRWAAGV